MTTEIDILSIDELNDNLQEKRAEIAELLKNNNASHIKERVELGKIVSEVEQNPNGVYGHSPLTKLEGTLLPANRSILRGAMYMYNRIAANPDDTLDFYLELKHPETGEGLSISHMTELVRITDVKDRRRLATQCVESGMSVADLNQAIAGKQENGDIQVQNNTTRPKAAPKGGRPVKKPATFSAMGRQMSAELKKMRNRFDQAWCSGDDDDFPSMIENLPDDDLYSTRTYDLVENVVSDLTSVASYIESTLYSLQPLMKRIEGGIKSEDDD